jgi:4-hydroxythreonine-4-phosphate dehydrogenase
MGDPCGIGPEIIVRALGAISPKSDVSFLVVGDKEVMAEAAARYGDRAFKKQWAAAPKFQSAGQAEKCFRAGMALLAKTGLSMKNLEPGRAGAREGKAMWSFLESAMVLVASGFCHALVTAPVTKRALKTTGFPFLGHTDWLAERAGGRAVMMLAAGRFRVAPVTAHIPLSQVSRALTMKKILDTIETVNSDLQTRFKIRSPRIAVAGLNPHAGEAGMLGTEEERVIEPAVQQARSKGIFVTGPHPADTLFTPQARKAYAAAVCMYHDQAMIPIKTMGMHKAVNVTLGLPVIRTSPAHGSAPEIAWKGEANPGSMTEAVKLAVRLAGSKFRKK